ncbi:MAG: tetratricopeptide repeat protein [Pirellulales bacterium]|nr:tetratricopeptide repeat protein [Pirellulales bacterium]
MASLRAKLAAARQYQQTGRMAQAEQLYRQMLQQNSSQPDALQFLGLRAYERGEFEQALQLLQRAARHAPSNAYVRANLGAALQSLGRLDEAIACYRQSISINPNLAHAHNNLAVACKRLGRLDEAIQHAERAIRLRPDYAEAHSNLGNALRSVGRIDEALAQQLRAIELRPDYAEGQNNLGLVHMSRGDFTRAIECFHLAIRLKPTYADAYDSLGSALRSLGRETEAAEAYAKALELNPRFASAQNNLGALLHAAGRVAESVPYYQAALAIEPQHALAHQNLADAFHELDDLPRALAHYRQAERLRPSARLRMVMASLLPPVYSSIEQQIQARAQITSAIDQLVADGVQLDAERDTLPSLFYLAYQGDSVRCLLEKAARCYRPANVPLDVEPGAAGVDRPIRIGFISRLFKNHTIGRLNQGFIAELSRPLFDVTVVSRGHYEDDLARFIQGAADRTLEIPEQLAASAEMIRSLKLDVLFYTDVGMDPLVTSLAYRRLAPVQVVGWGHPVTTASPAMDYFLSNASLEPPGSEQEYTEQLVRLSRLPSYYYRPQLSGARRPRSAFGLPADGTLYMCPQSLFKFHPDFDALMGEILRRDPRARIVLVEAMQTRWNVTLRERFRAGLGPVSDRIVFVPRVSTSDFLHLLSHADVLLDPLHFGGGNTAYEGLGLGIPIVTLPGAYLRSRVTYGCYEQLGVRDCIATSAEEFVEQAVRLGTDGEWRRQVSNRILAARHELFEDRALMGEFEAFLLQAARQTPQRH